MTATATLLPDGKRLHLQHGPIDLIIGADGDRDAAFAAAKHRFASILDELMAEYAMLRVPVGLSSTSPQSPVAQRMYRAVHPFHADGYVTSMAAVAGSVADEVLAAMRAQAQLDRAYVNNGGDIALHLTAGTKFSTAMAAFDGRDLGRITITHSDPVRGIATSGRHGRSLSLGIADSVTVLAQTAAQADVAATLIANRVDLPGHPAITRKPACAVIDDSDLGDLHVVTACAPLPDHDVEKALDAGLHFAKDCARRDLTVATALFLQDQSRATHLHNFETLQRTPAHA